MKWFGTRTLWAVSIPLLFAEVSEIVLHVTDTLFLSRVGITELGAVGLADSAIELTLVLALGLIDGIQILTARQLGKGRPRRAARIFNLGFVLTVTLSALLALVLFANARPFATWLLDSEDVSRATVEFLSIAAIGIPFTVACFAYSALLVGLGRTRILIPATLLLTATNAGLDWILVFGKFGVPAMGMKGSAWGSVVAEVVTCAFLTAHVFTRPESRRFGVLRRFSWLPRTAAHLVRMSAPIGAQGAVEGLRWFGFFLILEKLGPVALAVANVVYVCYSVLRIPTEAFGEIACSTVSRLIGRERTDRIEIVVHQSIGAAGIVTLPLILVALLLPEPVLSLFALEPALLATGAASLRVVALSMLVVVPAQMWHNALLGTGDTPAVLGIEVVLTLVMLLAGWAAAFAFAGGVTLVWASLGLAWLVTLLVSWGWMKSGAWRRYA